MKLIQADDDPGMTELNSELISRAQRLGMDDHAFRLAEEFMNRAFSRGQLSVTSQNFQAAISAAVH